MSLADVDAVVVGAGVVGLAVARTLALAGREVLVLEAEGRIGSVTSSRNSEVIHAGFNYPPGSLKAGLCVAGARALYDYCARMGIAHRRCGKLVVACDAWEIEQLCALQRQGRANGVDDLALINGDEARALEPALSPEVRAALHSPATGIIDSHGYMLALQGEAEAHGAQVVCRAAVARVMPRERSGFVLHMAGGDRLSCRALVNAAGLGASALASTIAGLAACHVPATRLAKGSYFSLARPAPFRRLIYPAPPAHGLGLGVHLTFDLASHSRFGPDAEWVEAIDYAVDPARGDGFEEAIRRYWPGLPHKALAADYAGMRPKIAGENGAAPDFRIDGAGRHGIAGLVNLFGIESPGLTSSLAIAAQVARALA